MDNLPGELIQLIISFLDSDLKLVARAINKRLFNIVNKRNFVTFFVSKAQLEEVVDTFSRCANPFSLAFKKNKFGIKDISNHITRLRNLTGLEIEMLIRESDVDSSWMALTVLTDLQHLNTYNIPNELYAHLKELTRLVDLQVKDPAQIDFLTSLSKLQCLEVRCEGEYNPFELIKNPKILTELTVGGNQMRFKPEDLNPFVGLRDIAYSDQSRRLFPASKFTRLEYLGIDAYDIDEYPTALTSLAVSEVPPHHLTKLTNLQYLRINWNKDWPDNDKQELVTFIKAQGLTELRLLQLPDPETFSNYLKELTKFTRLQSLCISVESRCQLDVPTFTKRLNSLTSLVDLRIRFHPRMPLIELEISTTMTKLTSLTINRCKLTFESAPLMTSLKEINGVGVRNILSFDLIHLTQLEVLYDLPNTPKMVNLLTKFQNLTSLSANTVSPALNEAIGQLTNLRMLTITVNEHLNMEVWTNLRKLTWLDLNVSNTEPLQKLTLLTSLERLTPHVPNTYQLDQQMLLEKMPKLYDLDVSYYWLD